MGTPGSFLCLDGGHTCSETHDKSLNRRGETVPWQLPTDCSWASSWHLPGKPGPRERDDRSERGERAWALGPLCARRRQSLHSHYCFQGDSGNSGTATCARSLGHRPVAWATTHLAGAERSRAWCWAPHWALQGLPNPWQNPIIAPIGLIAFKSFHVAVSPPEL